MTSAPGMPAASLVEESNFAHADKDMCGLDLAAGGGLYSGMAIPFSTLLMLTSACSGREAEVRPDWRSGDAVFGPSERDTGGLVDIVGSIGELIWTVQAV
jgi:hypothetical protein